MQALVIAPSSSSFLDLPGICFLGLEDLSRAEENEVEGLGRGGEREGKVLKLVQQIGTCSAGSRPNNRIPAILGGKKMMIMMMIRSLSEGEVNCAA